MESEGITSLLESEVGQLIEPGQWACERLQATMYTEASMYGRDILESNIIRREAEQCDRVSDFLFALSLYGGTGSGFICR